MSKILKFPKGFLWGSSTSSYQVEGGIATNNTYYESFGDPISILVKNIIEQLDHFYILNKIKNYQEFIGLNYYFHNRIKGFKFNQNENKLVSDLGWKFILREFTMY